MAITTSRYAIFNGYNLNNVPGLSVYSISPPGTANRTLNIFGIARANSRKVSSAFYDSNKIQIGVYITAASREALEAAMDTLLANLQLIEGTLIIPRSGGTARAYTVTYDAPWTINNTMDNTDSPASNYADLTLSFQTSDSYGYDQFFTPILGPTAANSSPNSWNYNQGGSADTQVPFLQFYFTGGSLGLGTVTIGNNNSGQQVSITRTWSVGDTLQINSQNNTVQVNGVDVNFTGAIPTFGIGQQTITYSDTFTSRNYQYYFYVYNRWN
jgi:hypothetical protein